MKRAGFLVLLNINRNGDPDLPVEGDSKVLFDPFKEKFHLGNAKLLVRNFNRLFVPAEVADTPQRIGIGFGGFVPVWSDRNPVVVSTRREYRRRRTTFFLARTTKKAEQREKRKSRSKSI